MLNLSVVLEESARRTPDKEAIVMGSSRLTYAALDAAANRVANALTGLGVEAGDRVALSCPNLPYFPIVYYGILKAGAVVVPLNVLLKRREIAYHLDDAGARVYFCFEGTAELPMLEEGAAGFAEVEACEHLVALPAKPGGNPPIEGVRTLDELIANARSDQGPGLTQADDTAVILYTSGTTGQPKGAELTHSNLFMNARTTADMLAYVPQDKALIVLPLFHSFGQICLLVAGALSGVTSALLPRFDPGEALAVMHAEGITVFAGVPTMYWALLHHDDPAVDRGAIAEKLRVAVSGGASLPLQVLRDFEEKFDVPILEGYGLSETSPVASFNQLHQPRKPGSVGTPIWGIRMRIVDSDGNELPAGESGEIAIAGHNVMKGYFRRPEATAETIRDGWLHTGDVGTCDEDGYFYIVDRTKDMIIRGGFNVYPREVEEALVEHPDVSLAAVIGIPSERHGEEIKAFIVPAPGAEPSPDQLIAWSKERLAAYKYPREIELRDSLPMNATGKILKRELRAEGG